MSKASPIGSKKPGTRYQLSDDEEEAKRLIESGAGPAAVYMKPKQTATAVGAMAAPELIPEGLGGTGIMAVLTRIALRSLAAGGGAATGKMSAEAVGGEHPLSKENLQDTAVTSAAFAGGQGLGEAFGAGLPALRSSLSRLAYTGEVAADGTPVLSKFARSLIHPTELTENVLRKAIPPTPEAVAAAKAQAGEATASKLEERMTATEAARQKELAANERLKNLDAQSRMTRQRQQDLLDAKAAKNVSPFPNATASSIGNLALKGNPETMFESLFGKEFKEAGDLSEWETGSRAGNVSSLRASGWAPPEPAKIVSPLSPAPPINKTLVSYDRQLLVHMARGGDLNALRELIRNPGGINVSEAVPNSKYLMEEGRPTNIYGGPEK